MYTSLSSFSPSLLRVLRQAWTKTRFIRSSTHFNSLGLGPLLLLLLLLLLLPGLGHRDGAVHPNALRHGLVAACVRVVKESHGYNVYAKHHKGMDASN